MSGSILQRVNPLIVNPKDRTQNLYMYSYGFFENEMQQALAEQVVRILLFISTVAILL